MYRSKTLRQMPPTTRKVAKLISEGESVIRRLKNQLPQIARLELDSRALANLEVFYKTEAPPAPGDEEVKEALESGELFKD